MDGLVVLAALVAVQFVPVERSNPPVDPALAIERHLPSYTASTARRA